MNLSLRIKMILGWMVIVVVPLTIIGTSFYIYVSNSLESITKEKTERIAENLAGMIRYELQGELKTMVALAVNPQIADAISSGRYNVGIESMLKEVYAKIGAESEGIFVTDKYGVIRIDAVDRQRVGLDLGYRDYFRQAKSTGQPSIGDPVFSRVTGKPIVVICVPVFDDNRVFVGIIANSFNIDYLSSRVTSVRIGKTSYAFMLNRKGIIIADPSKEYILKADATTMPGVEKLAARMISQETGTERYSFRNVDKFASFAPVNVGGWSIAVTQNREELMASANAIRMFYLVGGIIFLLLTTSGIYYFSRSISTPIQKSLSTLNKAIEQSEEVFAIIGLDRKIQLVNPSMERLTGCRAIDLVGVEPILNNTKNVPAEEVWQTLNQGSIWAGCIVGTNKEEASYNLDVTITPVRDDKGAVSCYLEIGRDITRELHMEAQLRQGQKMEAIGTMAGGIAHDFNNILSAIFGYAELSLLTHGDQAKTSRYIQEILSAARRARDLVNQILTFSRQAEQGKRPLEPRYLIKEALKLLRASLPTTIEIQDAVNSKALILGDPTQLHQVVMNLCTNAGHAMRDKGGVLKVSLDDIDVDEDFAALHHGIRPGRHLQLKVSDTGHGISPEIRERIFDPFFTTKPQGEGTGLGLSVVHGIVKSLGGIINVYSEPDKGTEFTICLPVISSDSLPVEEETDAELPGGTERVMLVDDEPALINVGKSMLESLGYIVTGFTESDLALEAFRRNPESFDVVVTDSTMPQLTGFELAMRMKAIRVDIPIALCSGHFDKAMEEKARRIGIIELLGKPITRQDLAHTVRKVLDKSKIT